MSLTVTQSRISKLLVVVMALLFISFATTSSIEVADAANNAAKLAGVSIDKSKADGVVKEGKGLVYLMMAVGFVIIAGCLVIAAVKLAMAGQGQSRAEAIKWLAGAFVGAFIVYKAFDILGYAISFGSGTA